MPVAISARGLFHDPIRARPLGIVTGLTAEAHIARRVGTALAGGGTTPGAAQAAEALVAGGVRALLSFGLAGGLQPGMAAGAIVIPRLVVTRTQSWTTDPDLIEYLGGATSQSLYGGDAVVAAARDKAALWAETGACAIDLETAAVAEVASRHGLPFAVLRAVCDPAERSLPEAALLALDNAGAISIVKVLMSVLRQPAQVPSLIELARDAARAKAALTAKVAKLSGPA